MSQPVFSIVTVAAFDHYRLERTFQSFSKVETHLEYIVVVPSNDFLGQKMVEDFASKCNFITLLLLDKGDGIYSAMNVAVRQASGRFIIFWNAGDTLSDSLSLSSFVEHRFPASVSWIIFGANFDWIKPNFPNLKTPLKFINQNPDSYISHQQIAVSRERLLTIGGFNTKYEIAADFDVIAKLSGEVPYIVNEYVLVNIEFPHTSSIKNRQGRWETFLILLRMRPTPFLGIMRILLREVKNLTSNPIKVQSG